MSHIVRAAALALAATAPLAAAVPPDSSANPNSFITVWSPAQAGYAASFFTEMTRTSGSAAPLAEVSLKSTRGRAAAIDLSDIPDDEIGSVDRIRIRKDVTLRYDPATRSLVLHTQ